MDDFSTTTDVPEPASDRASEPRSDAPADVPVGDAGVERRCAPSSSEIAPPEEASAHEPAPIEPDLRARLMRQFEQWVDRMLAGEAPPAGLPPEILAQVTDSPEARSSNGDPVDRTPIDCDLYTLFSGLTTLSGEIRLQGRAFKQLTDTLGPLAGVGNRLDRLEAAQLESLDQLAGVRDVIESSASDDRLLHVSDKDVCAAMIDLHDRLDRGLATCDSGLESLRDAGNARPRGLSRWFGRSDAARDTSERAIHVADGIRESISMTLARLESLLHDWGIQRVGRIGEHFDPQRMTALHVRADASAEPDTVVEVNRSGYAVNGQVFAPAQVTVARR